VDSLWKGGLSASLVGGRCGPGSKLDRSLTLAAALLHLRAETPPQRLGLFGTWNEPSPSVPPAGVLIPGSPAGFFVCL
jgi:hypothetical protein